MADIAKQIFRPLKLKYNAPNLKKLNLFPSSSVIYPYRLGLCKKTRRRISQAWVSFSEAKACRSVCVKRRFMGSLFFHKPGIFRGLSRAAINKRDGRKGGCALIVLVRWAGPPLAEHHTY